MTESKGQRGQQARCEGLVAREARRTGTGLVKRGLATQLRGGVIMDVVPPSRP